MYKLFIALSFICIVVSIINKPRKMRLNKNSIIRRENILINKLDKILCRHKVLNNLKEKYISVLSIINCKDWEHNNKLILSYVFLDIIISFLLFATLLNIITMWYAVIIIDIAVFYMILQVGTLYINIKTNKIHRQFPIALQCFLDEYIINKNIKGAINSSYRKMPKEIGNVFEHLARELSGGKDYKECIKKFANKLSYIWGHSFAEILIISYDGAGDITDELLSLNNMISEEITAEEENRSSHFGNKITFIILNCAALAGLIINMYVNDLSRHVYFYTSIGNMMISIWLIVLILGTITISIFDKV